PTAPAWRSDLPEDALTTALAALEGPLRVYVHVPFCREQCLYCGCNMVVARRQEAGDRYLDALEAQLTALPGPVQREASRLHLGGGTPTWLTPAQLDRLFGMVRSLFSWTDGHASVEVDPEVTTGEHLDALARNGVGRLSVGVQSFDPVVQEAVNRVQDPDGIRAVVEGARSRGIARINLDLIYGLPHQGVASMEETLTRAIALRPDRLAVFGYAHVPWMKPHQQRLDAEALPGPEVRAELLLLAQRRLIAAGYDPIGFDHFALPDDPLAVAAREGRLNRDFMGYTAQPDMPLVGFGPSAISQLADRFLQVEPHLGRWTRAALRGSLPVVRGMILDREDQLRQEI
ncbi:MAG: oxygen-independent coproporphyrinogen III oxidase, partial [Myxococcales bacterium]|nr:oxygen-independent coproporphyrinogen III oxidase [Myxococcales bacterium]